jgi:ribosomal protein L31E
MARKFEIAEGYYKLKDLAKGEFIKRKPTAKKVYIKGEYDRGSKTYSVYDTDDINSEIFLRGTTKVWAGFIY